jgi:hypothetical protein
MKSDDAFIKTFPATWVVTIVLGIIIAIVFDTISAISFALGSVTSLMMMSMLFKSSNKVLNMTDKVQAQRQTAKNYAMRYFFYVLILVISAIHPNINVLFVAIGLFVFKLCLYGMIFLEKKGGDLDV